MRFLRILPEVCARMECSLSSLTRNMALGSSSITVPLNSIISSFDIRPLRIVTNGAAHGRGASQGQEPAWSPSAEQRLDLGLRQTKERGPSMTACRGPRRCLHLPQQRVHLGLA